MRLPTGCNSLDNLLSSGIEAGVITQVYGPPGSGKTQLCHTLCMMLPSDYNAIYIDTEGCFRPEIPARTIVIATGAEYRRPPCKNLSRFEGAGVYYGATFVEAQLCGGEEVIVVGGGNSAGQATVFLAQTTKNVHMLVRSAGLAESMSRYLIRRIEESPNIVT